MQPNQELSMSMFANKEDYETACAELKLSNPEKTVFDIKADPSLVLQLREGDQVCVDGVVLDMLCIPFMLPTGHCIYFRTVDSRPDEYNNLCKDDEFKGEYKDYIKHLRKKQEGKLYGSACLNREEFKALLESGNYYIG